MIELYSSMKKRLMKMLLDSGANGNSVLDAMVATLTMQVYDNEDFYKLIVANGTIVLTTGCAQFVMNCGAYKSKIVVRVFPNLHEECILGMPWLEYENPIIDWI